MLGVLPGTMGLLQATEVVKLILGVGEPLIGRLLMYDALGATFTELKVRRDPECPICSRDRRTRSPTRRWASSPTTRRSAPPLARVTAPMATIQIPPVLRPSVGGEREVSADGGNVGEVLRSLADAHPETRGQLFGADGELNRYVNVYLNDEDVRVLDGLETPVGAGDSARHPAGDGRRVAAQAADSRDHSSSMKRWSSS